MPTDPHIAAIEGGPDEDDFEAGRQAGIRGRALVARSLRRVLESAPAYLSTICEGVIRDRECGDCADPACEHDCHFDQDAYRA